METYIQKEDNITMDIIDEQYEELLQECEALNNVYVDIQNKCREILDSNQETNGTIANGL